jgi:hypothetical protein
MGQETPEIVRLGQVRVDKHGGTIRIVAERPGPRYLVEYPQLEGEIGTLSTETIVHLYPNVVNE